MALATTSQPITEIQLRRTACYGVCPDDELTIRTDGTASYSGMQSARRGDWRGKIARADARRLAQTIESIGFEKLEASYGQPNIDAPDYIVTVTRGNRKKSVVSHMQQAPPVVAIITAILETEAKIDWKPVSSGIEGKLLVKGKPTGDFPFVIMGNGHRYHALSDHDGHVRLPLLPGPYTVEGAKVRVVAGRYTRVDVAPSRAIFRAPHV